MRRGSWWRQKGTSRRVEIKSTIIPFIFVTGAPAFPFEDINPVVPWPPSASLFPLRQPPWTHQTSPPPSSSRQSTPSPRPMDQPSPLRPATSSRSSPSSNRDGGTVSSSTGNAAGFRATMSGGSPITRPRSGLCAAKRPGMSRMPRSKGCFMIRRLLMRRRYLRLMDGPSAYSRALTPTTTQRRQSPTLRTSGSPR